MRLGVLLSDARPHLGPSCGRSHSLRRLSSRPSVRVGVALGGVAQGLVARPAHPEPMQ
jgi:hypothetical protein